jgi:hypothetical protein
MVPSLQQPMFKPRPTMAAADQRPMLRHWLLVQLGLSGVAWAILAAGIFYIV